MPNYTNRLKLYKPNFNDEIDVADSLSNNFQIIDDGLEEMERQVDESVKLVRETMSDQNTQSNIEQIKIWTGTVAQYENLSTVDPSTIYFVRQS